MSDTIALSTVWEEKILDLCKIFPTEEQSQRGTTQTTGLPQDMPVPWRSDPSYGQSVPFRTWSPLRAQIEDASDRAITLQQLRNLRDYIKRLCKAGILKKSSTFKDGTKGTTAATDDRVFWFTINQYDINELVLKKIIPQERACSWVELVADPTNPAQPPDTYLSHAWAESFRDLMLSIEHHAQENRVDPDHTYWYCLCANNQWDISGQLNTTLKTSPFFRALENSRETLLLMDRQGIVMKRAWCLFEWYETIEGLKRADSLKVATGLGMVGSSMVQTGIYVDMLKGLDSKEAQASDPRDLRRIQNSIVGEDETKDLVMIARIESATKSGRIVVEKEHCLQTGDIVVYHVGVGDPLFFHTDCGQQKTAVEGDKFIVKLVSGQPRELELYRYCDDNRPELGTKPLIMQGGTMGNLVRNDYATLHEKWLDAKVEKFVDLDEKVVAQATSDCEESRQSRRSLGDNRAPAYRAITLMELRAFYQEVKKRFQDEAWNRESFEKAQKRHRSILGRNEGPGEHYGNSSEFGWDGEWKSLTWYHIKHLVILDKLLGENNENNSVEDLERSYVDVIPGKKALRGQYHFTFNWNVPFSEFMDGIEWLAEARRMPDTTPFLIYPLTMNVATRKEYYDSTVWEHCMRASEAAVVHTGNLNRAGPLLDIHNAVSQNKSIDLVCATGTLALVRPFAAGSWEFGRFDVASALKYVDINVFKAQSHEKSYHDRFMSIGKVGLSKLNRKLRSAGAGPVLRDAAFNNDTTRVENVFRQCPWLSMQSARLQGPLGETPLHIAASTDSIQVLEMLLQKSADVNAMDFDGETPLHLAALAGKTRSARILLDAGADPMQESFFSETPLEVALQKPAFFLIDYRPVQELLRSFPHEYVVMQHGDAWWGSDCS
ncbi:Ankyrin Repeat Protein [Seminavis robusta]|uniref:Ankyrin Repeat Protein n=1 Tax=Seminavis robusta TaxID=568900 RepID=A0A9N8HG77_9STRA|nr:Ankyrin Repeat Protein [Seminavis robusta]|eukprot:Sro562_g166920.1 Ankyrin Repeat Protein (889) ;mRNA; r:1791-4457